MEYWISWYSWCENYPDAPWKFWLSGEGCRYKIRPSVAGTLTESEEKAAIDAWDDEKTISDGTFCALIIAESEEAAWAEVVKFFPDYEQRFCIARPGLTHEKLAESGRFC